MSDDYTRVLLTPIIDVDYYLPYFRNLILLIYLEILQNINQSVK